MNIRTTILLAVLLLIAANTVLVVSDIPPCPPDGGTPKYVPGECPCPKPENVNCDIDGFVWGSRAC